MNSATTHCVTGREQLERARLGREPAERHRRERVAERLERPQPVVDAREADQRAGSPNEHERQRDVEEPEPPRRVADPLGELVDLRPGQLGLEHLPAADSEPWEHGEREHDDPHPAEPLAELAPEQQRAIEALDVGERSSRRWS